MHASCCRLWMRAGRAPAGHHGRILLAHVDACTPRSGWSCSVSPAWYVRDAPMHVRQPAGASGMCWLRDLMLVPKREQRNLVRGAYSEVGAPVTRKNESSLGRENVKEGHAQSHIPHHLQKDQGHPARGKRGGRDRTDRESPRGLCDPAVIPGPAVTAEPQKSICGEGERGSLADKGRRGWKLWLRPHLPHTSPSPFNQEGKTRQRTAARGR